MRLLDLTSFGVGYTVPLGSWLNISDVLFVISFSGLGFRKSKFKLADFWVSDAIPLPWVADSPID